jgi:magnesium transporter
MIRCYLLENNKVKPSPEFNVEKIIWCDALEPTDDELITISQKFNINIEDLQDCLDQSERPRFNYDYKLKNNFLLLRAIQSFEIDMTDRGVTAPIGIIFTNQQKLVTIHSSLAQTFNAAIDLINRGSIENPWYLITEIIHILVKQMDQVAQRIATKILDIQDSILKYQMAGEIQQPFQLNSYLIFYNTSMLANDNAIKSFFTRHKHIFETDIPLLENYDDVMTDIDQVYHYTSIYRDQFSNIIDAFASVINNNLSNVMKVVGSISLILMIPTLIASIYGMNVGLPGGATEGDYVTLIIILVLSFILSFITWFYFRRRNWL